MAGRHFIKAWSKTRATRALSSAEAELHAVVRATSEGIGIENVMKDFGRNMGVCILTDASAASGIVRRRCGTSAPLLLLVQDKSESKEVKHSTIEGSRNPADLLAKHLSGTDMHRFVCRMGTEYRDGHDDQGLSIHCVDRHCAGLQAVRCGGSNASLSRGSARHSNPESVLCSPRSRDLNSRSAARVSHVEVPNPTG